MAPTTTTAHMHTREQAAKILGMGIATFDRLRYAGKIVETRVSPHKIRFTDEALSQYLAGQTKTCSAENKPEAVEGTTNEHQQN